MIGGAFWKLAAAALYEILLQMCSGRMGIQSASMLALGLLQYILTVVASGAVTRSMNCV